MKSNLFNLPNPTRVKVEKIPLRQSSIIKFLSHGPVYLLASLILLFSFFPKIVFPQTADSTHQLIVENIEIHGNTKTNQTVIRKYLTIHPGDVITPALLDMSHRRLSRTNFFKEVEFYTRPGSEKGKLVVVIDVKERRWPYFQFEGGHSDLNGWFFVPASLRFDNFFGKGNFIGLRWFIGDRISKLSLAYRNPSLFDGSAFLDLELFSANKEFIHYLGRNGLIQDVLGMERATQEVRFGGLRFQFGGNEGLFKFINFAYRIEDYQPDGFIKFTALDSTSTSLPTPIAADIDKTQIGAFSLILHADLRDNPIYPLNGFWGALSLELAHDEVGSERNFPRVTFDSRFYKRVFGRQVFALHLKGGYTNDKAPFYERFYLGGANSLRGYPDRRLTPVGWGTKLFLMNTEFRFPLSRKDFPFHKASGVLFFDAGGIWLPGQNPQFNDLFAAAGFGFRVELPVLGITRFDFSFPLNKVDNNDFQFHVSLGHTF